MEGKRDNVSVLSFVAFIFYSDLYLRWTMILERPKVFDDPRHLQLLYDISFKEGFTILLIGSVEFILIYFDPFNLNKSALYPAGATTLVILSYLINAFFSGDYIVGECKNRIILIRLRDFRFAQNAKGSI